MNAWPHCSQTSCEAMVAPRHVPQKCLHRHRVTPHRRGCAFTLSTERPLPLVPREHDAGLAIATTLSTDEKEDEASILTIRLSYFFSVNNGERSREEASR